MRSLLSLELLPDGLSKVRTCLCESGDGDCLAVFPYTAGPKLPVCFYFRKSYSGR
jgi:hypothetical protein